MSTIPTIEKHLEPAAVEAFANIQEALAASATISLKRIADALEKLNSGDVNAYGIGAEFGRGMGEHFVAVMAQNGR